MRFLIGAVLVGFISFVSGAHLEYYDGGFFSQSQVSVTDPGGTHTVPVDADYDPSSASSGGFASTADSSGDVLGKGQLVPSSLWPSGLSVYLESKVTTVSLYEFPDADISGYTGAGTVTPGYSDGLFLFIAPDDEQYGDTVTIEYEWKAYTDTNEDLVHFRGPGGVWDMYLTYGPEAPVTEAPDPADVIWTKESFDTTEPIDLTETGTFEAQIGEVIGVFIDASVEIMFSTSQVTEAIHSMDLRVVQDEEVTVDDADLDKSGRVDLGDVAVLASFWMQNSSHQGGNNDSCAYAFAIPLGQYYSGMNTGATGDPMDSCSGGNDIHDVWHSFTAPSDMLIEIVLEPQGDFDSALSIWDACDGMELDCDERYGNEYIEYDIMAGEKIYIRVAGYEGVFPSEGQYILRVNQLD